MQTNKAIHELNQFLEGRYMGIHAYEHYISKAKDTGLKLMLQELQKDMKQQAARIAERIQNLGGQAATDLGFAGKIQEAILRMKGYPDSAEEILQDSFIGEHKYALHRSHEIIQGDLDDESAKLVDDILQQNQEHADRIKSKLQELGAAVPQEV